MGVDINCYLPDSVSIEDAATALARLAGLPIERHEMTTGWYATVPGVATVGLPGLPSCAEIRFERDGEQRHVLWHWDANLQGHRLLAPRSTAFWIAVCRGLIDFFGGMMIYNDCNDHTDPATGATRFDYEQPDRGWEANHPSTGEPWQRLQERLLALPPLTPEEIRQWDTQAAYTGRY